MIEEIENKQYKFDWLKHQVQKISSNQQTAKINQIQQKYQKFSTLVKVR